jgi:outer membrane lipoprotein SlyB
MDELTEYIAKQFKNVNAEGTAHFLRQVLTPKEQERFMSAKTGGALSGALIGGASGGILGGIHGHPGAIIPGIGIGALTGGIIGHLTSDDDLSPQQKEINKLLEVFDRGQKVIKIEDTPSGGFYLHHPDKFVVFPGQIFRNAQLDRDAVKYFLKLKHGLPMEEGENKISSLIRPFKSAEVLTANARHHIADKNFVDPKHEAYPIPDAAHARNALARSSGKAIEAKVRAKVHEKFPGIEEKEKKEGEKLTAKTRAEIPTSEFALPAERKYPLENRSHAANAEARASGKPEEAQVDAAVHAKYPDMGEKKACWAANYLKTLRR